MTFTAHVGMSRVMQSILAWSVILAAILAQAFITMRLWRSDLYSRGQKVAQSVLIWVLPVLGSVIVYAGLRQRDDVPRLEPNRQGGDHESLWCGGHH